MTHVHRAYIYLLLVMATMLCVEPVWADKKEKKVKHEYSSTSDIQPDPVARKSRPDRHPKAIEMPMLAGVRHVTGSRGAQGIDVSHYQGRINWNEVSRDPQVTYVYLKATEGAAMVDDTYQYNFQECKRMGLKVGSYLFFRPNVSAKVQFDLFVSRVDTKKQDLLPMVDVEVTKGASIEVMQARLIELCELLEKEYGKKPLIYTGRNFYNNYIHSNPRLRGYKYFIAAYSPIEPTLTGNSDYVMWQYSSTGSVRGIRGNVDMSRFVGGHTIRDIVY